MSSLTTPKFLGRLALIAAASATAATCAPMQSASTTPPPATAPAVTMASPSKPIALISNIATQPAPQPTDGYKLVWADEFNTDGPLNPKDWSNENGFVRNQELQWYQPENATCSGGLLIIEGRKEEKPNPRYRAGSTQWQTSRQNIEYTAASVNTKGKHSWLYGRFEVRAKIDTHAGSWPAFWTLGNTGGWPAGGEIDIMEFYKSTLLANFVWAQSGGNGQHWNSKTKPINTFAKDWSDQFHIWRMDWTPDAVNLYCDGELRNTQDLTKTINPNGVNPFHAPEYIMLNQAIGANGGDPSKTTFPIRFLIDYVRVYQIPK